MSAKLTTGTRVRVVYGRFLGIVGEVLATDDPRAWTADALPGPEVFVEEVLTGENVVPFIEDWTPVLWWSLGKVRWEKTENLKAER